ncbi:hypothetical protein Pmar_PMAR003292 [Perkinsus marinus ATCC 50983]|uniref:Uncharacterized protein n=1 Tax=Perkinsus marinus (strain ATCC 50983 / TXsc) TaxID=423536 RepID=C5KGX8_PERM5|nr:hypothetical protein Pmar_PMAR003292 [Perkinsus marinus ATCC 50983]EER15840.1 hypothetical protein Pmar_PMAR003292 [Perkinsus marinus ATCC 50983]|eukprot:XP_002784044.1 hypothetical protein Pmar_PMAR003292 [Perkinsus marinus ATCC 50983]
MAVVSSVLLPSVLVLWAGAEVLFYIWFRKHVAKQTRTPAVVPEVRDAQRDYVLEKTIEMLRRHPEGLWRLLKGWFEPGVQQDDLRDENMSEFFAWAFYYKHLEVLLLRNSL